MSLSFLSTDLGVGETRLRALEYKETSSESSSLTISNGDFVVGTEDDGPVDLSISGYLPKTNDLSGLNTRIANGDDDLEAEGPPVVKSREDEKKLKIKREISFVLPTLNNSCEEDEETIRYCICVLVSIKSFFFLFIFIYLNQSKRTNPRSQDVGAGS